MLVVLAILALLAGITYAYLGPARAKSRQSICVANLHQIGMALQMYRSDWGGSDVGSTPAEFGMPPGAFWGMLSYLGNNEEVLHCPATPRAKVDQLRSGDRSGRWSAYRWCVWDKPMSRATPEWADAVGQRGGDFPIVECVEHDDPRPDRPTATMFSITLRLNGAVTAQQSRKHGGWWRW